MFWAYFEMTVFPLLLLEVRGFFNSLHGDESGGACGDILMEVWIPQPNTGSPCFKLSNLSTLNLQQLISYCLGFSTLVLVPTEVCDLVNCDSLYLSVSSVFWGQWFALGPQFSFGFMKSCWLSVFIAFSLLCDWEWQMPTPYMLDRLKTRSFYSLDYGW